MATRYFEAEFGSIKIRFYPLTVGQIQDLEDEMKEFGRLKAGENPWEPTRYARLLKVYTASAQRGDPNITSEMVAKVVDLENIIEVNRAVMGQRGKPEITLDQKEEVVEGPTSPLIGGESTQK